MSNLKNIRLEIVHLLAFYDPQTGYLRTEIYYLFSNISKNNESKIL